MGMIQKKVRRINGKLYPCTSQNPGYATICNAKKELFCDLDLDLMTLIHEHNLDGPAYQKRTFWVEAL